MDICNTDWTAKVREMLLRTWLEQSCQRPADRPKTLERLLAKWGPLIDEAVAVLARLFADGIPPDPAHAVWAAFPRLDHERCGELAELLIDARVAR